MARRNLSARQPAKNIAAKPPARKYTNADGIVVTEKLCPIPFSKKFIAPDGSAVTIPMATGFTIRGWKGNDYGVQLMEEKLEQGFLPYDECPLATKRVERRQGDTPCDGAFSNEKCCPHLERIALARQEEHRKMQTEYGRNFSTQHDRMLRLLEAQTEKLGKEERAASGKKGISGG